VEIGDTEAIEFCFCTSSLKEKKKMLIVIASYNLWNKTRLYSSQAASAILLISALSSAVVVFLGACLMSFAGFPATTEKGGTS
jgi:hypothetical protein